MKYIVMLTVWTCCGLALWITKEQQDVEKLKEVIFMCCCLMFVLSVCNCVNDWVIDTYKEQCRKWEAIVDNKNFKMQDLLRLISTLKKEINNAK